MHGVLAVDQPDLFYARQQMAFSLGAHIVMACIGMSVPFLVVLAEWKGQRTGDLVYTTLARRWAKAMGVLFAVGAVSGTILSFEFGILWPRWMGRFGDVMGLPFAIEGFAFFLEAIFIGIYLYGWDRLPPRVHLWVGVADRHRRRRVGVLRRRRERMDERPDRLHARRERQRHARRSVGRALQLRAVARGDPHDPRRVHRRRLSRRDAVRVGDVARPPDSATNASGSLLPLTVAMLAAPVHPYASEHSIVLVSSNAKRCKEKQEWQQTRNTRP